MLTWAHDARPHAAADRTGQAEAERVRRIVQRPLPRRMPERALVHEPGARPSRDRDVATGRQRGATEEGTRRADARRLCQTADEGNGYSHRRTLKRTATQDGGTSVGHLIDYRSGLPREFEGSHVVPAGVPLNSVVRSIRVTRGTFVGPAFQVDGGTFISDPIIQCIERKFAKTYRVSQRLELLVFYELQSTPLAEMRVAEVEAFLNRNQRGSQFARVWVFDVENRSMLFVPSAQRPRKKRRILFAAATEAANANRTRDGGHTAGSGDRRVSRDVL